MFHLQVAVDGARNPREYLDSFWIDSLVHDESALTTINTLFGTGGKIVLGSDYPFPLGEQAPGKLVAETAILTEEEKAGILWRNAFEWLGVSDKGFRAAAEARRRDEEEKKLSQSQNKD